MAHPDSPLVIDAERTRAALAFPKLIDALRAAFVAGAEVPLRHRHAVAGGDGTLLLTWQCQGNATAVLRSIG